MSCLLCPRLLRELIVKLDIHQSTPAIHDAYPSRIPTAIQMDSDMELARSDFQFNSSRYDRLGLWNEKLPQIAGHKQICVGDDGGGNHFTAFLVLNSKLLDAPDARRNTGTQPKHLPRCEQKLESDTTACPCRQKRLHKIGENVSKMLDVISGKFRSAIVDDSCTVSPMPNLWQAML